MVAKLVDGLLGRPSVLLIVLGIAMFALSAAGSIEVEQGSMVLAERPWRIAFAVLGLIVGAFGGYLLFSERGVARPPRPLPIEYELFVASPMAANATPELKAQRRDETLRIISAFRTHAGIERVYYAGTKIKSESEYEPPDVAARLDLDAIRKSRVFVMYYPERSMSSVIFEAGFALALGKPAIYFVNETEDLPFLMQTAPNLPAVYPNVKIYQSADAGKVISLIELSGKNLLDPSEPS